jgi:hypothetical protein
MTDQWRMKVGVGNFSNGKRHFVEFGVEPDGTGFLRLLTGQGPHPDYPIGDKIPISAEQAGMLSSVADIARIRLLPQDVAAALGS